MTGSLLVLLAVFSGAQEASPVNPNQEEFVKAAFFGKKFFDLKEYTSAYEQFLRADVLIPDQPGILYNMAVILAKAGRYSEAQVKVDRYLQLFPGGAERPQIAKLQLELEFHRELQKKRQADQDYLELFNRGRFQYGKNELEAALKLFQEAEQLRPNDAAAVFNQAVIHERLGDLAKASERLKRFAELESDSDQKAGVDQRLFALETEIEDMRTKIVCSFCGQKLPAGAVWCNRCWHGPYLVHSPIWNSRPCIDGASATRAMYFTEDRFHKNDSLSCLLRGGTMLETLRYTPAKQRQIRDARRAEGWTYEGDVIQGWADKAGNLIRYHQGSEYLEKITSTASGDTLHYSAHKAGEGIYLLDREDVYVDAQRYTSRYTFDANNRIAQQVVEYQNSAACNHLITATADYTYQNDVLMAVRIKGGYDGFQAEGSPRVDWLANVAYTYDSAARVIKEDLAVTQFTKTYAQRPVGALREEVSRLYASMRTKRPIENAIRQGDLCATAGGVMLGNAIDLRPFYAMSPNLAIVLPPGVVRTSVSFTYPDSYKIR